MIVFRRLYSWSPLQTSRGRSTSEQATELSGLTWSNSSINQQNDKLESKPLFKQKCPFYSRNWNERHLALIREYIFRCITLFSMFIYLLLSFLPYSFDCSVIIFSLLSNFKITLKTNASYLHRQTYTNRQTH